MEHRPVDSIPNQSPSPPPPLLYFSLDPPLLYMAKLRSTYFFTKRVAKELDLLVQSRLSGNAADQQCMRDTRRRSVPTGLRYIEKVRSGQVRSGQSV